MPPFLSSPTPATSRQAYLHMADQWRPALGQPLRPLASRHPLLFPESRLDHTSAVDHGPSHLDLCWHHVPVPRTRPGTVYTLSASGFWTLAWSTVCPALLHCFPVASYPLPFDLASTRLVLPVPRPPLPRSSQGVAHNATSKGGSFGISILPILDPQTLPSPAPSVPITILQSITLVLVVFF